jgi:small-conductance mechanosensitive channel
MDLALALLASGAAAALSIALIAYLARSSLLIRRLAFPLEVAALAGGIEVFSLFPVGRDLPQLQQLRLWLVVFALAVALLRTAGLYLFDVYLHGRRGLRLPPLLPAVVMGVAYLITGFVILRLAVPSLNITPLVATSAVTSLVLGLALQPILSNFFAGLVISLERPFRINDWVRVGDNEGRVVEITWRTTHLRTRDNDNLVIPNARIADQEVLNYFYPHPMHMERVRVGVHYSTPPYRVRRALLATTTGVAGVLEKPTPDVYLLSFDDSAVTYELRIWIEDVAQAPRITSEIRNRIWEELRKSGITIPYPIRTLELAPRPRRRQAGETIRPPARLFVSQGAEVGLSLELDGDAVTVGRSRACRLSISDSHASKEHLRIEWTAEGYLVTDLNSSFGTRVNGEPATRRVLRDLDRIIVGETVLVFESDAA